MVWYSKKYNIIDIQYQNGNSETWFLVNPDAGTIYDELPSDISIIGEEDNVYSDMPFESIFLRPYKVLTIKIQNRSDETYYFQNDEFGKGAVGIYAEMYDMNGKLIKAPYQLNILAHDLKKNEILEQKIILSYQRGKTVSSYRFGLSQIGGTTTESGL